MFTLLLIFALVGVVAGLVAGLFGLGGGVVMVPALIYTFTAIGFDPSVLTHLAVGTSLACIVVTASVSSWTHWRKQAIDFSLLLNLLPGVILGAWLGGAVAARLDGAQLQISFGVFLLLVSFVMVMSVKDSVFTLPSTLGQWLAGGIIGSVSALFGVGGGSMTVPYLRLCGVLMQRAVATSAALGLPIAVVGSITYVWQGWNASALPDYSLGFVYPAAFVGLVVCSAPASRLGAVLAHRLPAALLQRAFAGVLVLVAAELIVSGMM